MPNLTPALAEKPQALGLAASPLVGSLEIDAFLEKIPAGAYTCDADGLIISYNQRAVEMWGRAPKRKNPVDRFCGSFKLFSADGTAIRHDQCWMALALQTNRGYNAQEIIVQRPSGERFTVLAHANPIYDETGKLIGALNVLVDITEHKRAAAALADTKEELIRQVHERTGELRALALQLTQVEQQERRRLAQLIHDDLQQLLVAARMQAGMAINRVADPEAREAIRRIDGMLHESIEASRTITVELSPPVLYDASFQIAMEWVIRHKKEKYGLDVTLEMPEGVEPADEKVRALLIQAIREVLFNVVKHSGVKAARVTVATEGNDLRITVSDKGKGCLADTASASKSSSGGFGLLSIRERLSLLGGRFEFHSQPGQGTRVTLSVPAKKPSAPSNSDAPMGNSGDAEPTPSEDGKLQVMLADDHEILREGIAGLLRSQDDIVVVGQASDGQAAIEMARRLRPHVVVIDVTMPGLSGIEVTRRIKALLPRTRIVALSMHREQDMADAMYQAGASKYLTKDGPSGDLVSAIRNHTTGRQGAKNGRRKASL